jgi:DNA invertase Pin-like site-specific DNA recombinase/shikimate kinase
MMSKTDLCAIYGRQSDPYRAGHQKTDTESLSISVQIKACGEKAKELNFVVADTFTEQITSDVFEDRPELKKLLSRLDRYKAIIVYKYDRIVREPDQLNLFIRACVAKGVRVISCSESEIGSDPISKMIGYVIGTVGQIEKIAIKKRVTDAKQAILDRGLILQSGTPKYGYQYKEGKRIIDPIKSKIVERIFTDVSNGIPLTQLAINLNKEKVAPPRVKWSQEGLGKIIRDPSYHGAPMVWGKSTPTEKRSSKNGTRVRVTAKGKPIGEATPAIVTRAIWDKAQQRVASNKKRGGGKTLTLWLRGHVFCGQCGHSMTPHPLHKDGKYEYRCPYGAQRKTNCVRAGYPIDEVEACVRQILNDAFDYPGKVRRLVEAALPSTVNWSERVVESEKHILTLKKKLAKLVAKIGDEEDSTIEEALNHQIKSVAQEVKEEEAVLEEARRLAGAARSKSQILADVDQLMVNRGHQEALSSLGVRVYLTANFPGESLELIVKQSKSHNKPRQLSPDKKGRERALILRLFEYDSPILNGRKLSNESYRIQELPVVSY